MENGIHKKRWLFLLEWSILNMIGSAVGIYFVVLFLDNLESLKHLAWVYGLARDFRKEWMGEIILVSFPLGLSIGILQWVKLRRFEINPFIWVFLTGLGFAVLLTLYSWVLGFDSFENRKKFDIPYWIINLGLAFTLPIGGAIIGSLQSISIHKHVSKPSLWIRAYAIGLLLPAIIAPIALSIKSLVIKALYSVELYTLVGMRWIIFFGFLFLVTVISISILTGDILLKQINRNSITINAANKACT